MSGNQNPNHEPAESIFLVGDIPIYGNTILAPMDGYSDLPFRSICRDLGSAMSYTEFVRAEKILQESKRPISKFRYTQEERPIVFQLYGDDPQTIVAAAIKARQLNPDIIDINMGCPARKVSNHGAGVGLMRTPLKVAKIFKELSKVLDIPVTGKIRLGWDDCKNHILIARIIEENGGALIAVHARTRQQGHSGEVDLDAIAEICSAVKIPVIGNGGVRLVADVHTMKEKTGCQAVMIGRGAISNPWIFAGKDRDQVSKEEVSRIVHEHLRRNMEFYGEEDGQRLFRKHAVQYLLLKDFDRQARKAILSTTPPKKFLALLDQINSFSQ